MTRGRRLTDADRAAAVIPLTDSEAAAGVQRRGQRKGGVLSDPAPTPAPPSLRLAVLGDLAGCIEDDDAYGYISEAHAHEAAELHASTLHAGSEDRYAAWQQWRAGQDEDYADEDTDVRE